MASDKCWRLSRIKILSFCFVSLILYPSLVTPLDVIGNKRLKETVLVVIFARNKAHTLPYFLGWLEKLDYPKNRIALWIRSDHNVDNTIEVLHTWLNKESQFYHDVNFKFDPLPTKFEDEISSTHWSPKRFRHIIRMKEEALHAARMMWADYVWFVDSDVFIIHNQTLNTLIEQNNEIVAPMLESLGAYSNYWCGMNEKYYYQRTEEYMPILERKKSGCFQVPMVHSSVLIDLRSEKSKLLSFDPSKNKKFNVPEDDIIAFALSAKAADISLHVVNKEMYGSLMVPLEPNHKLTDDYDQLMNIKVQTLCRYNNVENPAIEPSEHLLDYVRHAEFDTLDFDQVYLINLLRRDERRKKMSAAFHELGIKAKILEAVDGKTLNETFLKSKGIHMLPQYEDPYHKRPLTMGEIGCFLSHYKIWEEVVEEQYRAVIVFEDDIQFEPYFRKKVNRMMKEMQSLQLDWDLVYLGRKRLLEKDEPFVDGSSMVVKVEYSYWTLCYIISLEGAKKLLAAKPLSKMVPVDEFLPIMFDKHPESEWKLQFENRNLKAFSVAPLLVYPTHYTGDENYISDTEDSLTLHTEL